MDDIYKKHSLHLTDCLNSITIQKRLSLFFVIAVFGTVLLYTLRINRMPVMSSDMTMHLTNSSTQTKQTIEIVTSRRPNQLSKYITTSGEIAHTKHSVTQWSQHITPLIQNRSIHELDVFINNLFKDDFHASHFITISFNGRLGNNIFQLAALLSCAKRINYTAIVPSNGWIHSYFLLNITYDINMTNVKTFNEEKFGKYDKDIEDLDSSSNWTLSGYYQSWKYFLMEEDLIRRSLKFKPIIYEPARQFVDNLRLNNKTIVGIHVRRGDMRELKHKMDGYATAPLRYIYKSMKYFRDRYKNTSFVICSDEIYWCKTNIRGYNDTVFSNFENPGSALAVLSLCDHVIITSGTFGWWGAWLAGGDVVYFKGYPRPGSKIDKGMCREDYYPPHWIGID
ncbi:hypothetical protein ACJMK2_039056 [Sinanodonta woodiana]|uniref:L-Fucosyltransferase n=1 Tax=Sinanodonta woodiana TaxID=1069815 RepID=A0ABD3WAZ4_SINWO